MSPYRQGPPNHPPEPDRATWRQELSPYVPYLGLGCVAQFLEHSLDSTMRIVVFAVLSSLALCAMTLGRRLGVIQGRRLQHEAWLKSLGATESLDTIAVEVHAPRIRSETPPPPAMSPPTLTSTIKPGGIQIVSWHPMAGVDMTVEVVNGCARVVGQPMRTPDEAREDWDELTEVTEATRRRGT